MNVTYSMLSIMNDRVRFWRRELQAAFHARDAARAAECDSQIKEYALLTSQVLTALRGSGDSERPQLQYGLSVNTGEANSSVLRHESAARGSHGERQADGAWLSIRI
jgi:hypothetical protein